MELKERTFEDNQMEFVVVAIEATAKLLKVPVKELFVRLSKQGLIENYLMRCYSVLHTESIPNIAENLATALFNYENETK